MERALRIAADLARYRAGDESESSLALTLVSAHKGYAPSILVKQNTTLGRSDFVNLEPFGLHINKTWLELKLNDGVWSLDAHPKTPGSSGALPLPFQILRMETLQEQRPIALQSGDELGFPCKNSCDLQLLAPSIRGVPCVLRALQNGELIRYRIDISSSASSVAPG